MPEELKGRTKKKRASVNAGPGRDRVGIGLKLYLKQARHPKELQADALAFLFKPPLGHGASAGETTSFQLRLHFLRTHFLQITNDSGIVRASEPPFKGPINMRPPPTFIDENLYHNQHFLGTYGTWNVWENLRNRWSKMARLPKKQ